MLEPQEMESYVRLHKEQPIRRQVIGLIVYEQ